MRSVTIADIVARARIHADQRNSGFVSDAEALQLFNEVYPELYDELVDVDENYYITEAPGIAVSSATGTYALPGDFYKMVGVDFQAGSDRITLYRFNEADRNQSFTSATNIPTGTVYLRYVPAPTIYTSTSQTVDGIAGWDRLCSLRIAIDMMDAEESNTDRLTRKYQERLETIRGSLDRDLGMPQTVTDVSRASSQYLLSTLKYRLYGNNLHLITTEILSSFGGLA
jgi:hypothetical protein